MHEASVGFLNLTGIPEKHHMYPKRPMSSDLWRPTLRDAVSIVEDRLSLLNEGSLFILATRNELFPTTNGAAEKSAPILSKNQDEDHAKTGDHPFKIVGWKRLETFMHCHRGLFHEDADVNGIVIDKVSGENDMGIHVYNAICCWHCWHGCWHCWHVDICNHSSSCWHAGKMLLACWQSCCWHAGKVAGMPSTVEWGGLPLLVVIL